MKFIIFAAIVSMAFGINIRIKLEKEILPLSENVKIDTPVVKSLEIVHEGAFCQNFVWWGPNKSILELT